MAAQQKVTTCLWFDGKAEEAANHYTSIFKSSSILTVTRYGSAGPGPKGSVMTVAFEIEGRQFLALNGGPQYKFTEAVSFIINCESQDEVDYYWGKLTADGGEEGPCGWLKDKFGVTWQVVPNAFVKMLQDPDPAKSQRVMAAMMQMKKLHLPTLEKAYRG